ncbi:hypothetical protein ACFQX7_13580 [Luedemannella flava]
MSLVTIGAIFAVLGEGDGGPRDQGAVLPTTPGPTSAAASPTPSPTPKPRRTTGAPTAPRTTGPAPTSAAPTAATLQTLAAEFRKLVNDGKANGAIRPDVAEDLLQVLNNALRSGTSADVRHGLELLRTKVDQRANEPTAITETLAAKLLATVDRMLAIAPVTPTAA